MAFDEDETVLRVRLRELRREFGVAVAADQRLARTVRGDVGSALKSRSESLSG